MQTLNNKRQLCELNMYVQSQCNTQYTNSSSQQNEVQSGQKHPWKHMQ